MKQWLSIVLVAFCASVLNADTVADLSAKQLYVEFEKNEVAAEGKYKDRRIFISGQIKNIKKNLAGQPLVTLSAGALKFVSCRFPKESMSQLIDLQKGQDVKLTCTVNHKIITTVHLYDCTMH